jgi:hypothetical protein
LLSTLLRQGLPVGLLCPPLRSLRLVAEHEIELILIAGTLPP